MLLFNENTVTMLTEGKYSRLYYSAKNALHLSHAGRRRRLWLFCNNDYRSSLKISHILHNIFMRWFSCVTVSWHLPPSYIKVVRPNSHILLRTECLLNKNSSSLKYVAISMAVFNKLSAHSDSVTTN